jgi:hypothetical protein
MWLLLHCTVSFVFIPTLVLDAVIQYFEDAVSCGNVERKHCVI